MADPLTINLTKPIKSAKILDDYNPDVHRDSGLDTRQQSRKEAEIVQLCQTLNCLLGEVNRFYDEALAKNKDEIAKLSVEIANKILMQKVQKGDYQIESIVKEALQKAPTRQDVVVHLNPEDLSQCQSRCTSGQQDDPGSALASIKFVADQSVGRAECLLETPKGIIKSFIDEHMERISEALKKVE